MTPSTGRPPIGPQITLAVPGEVLAELERIATDEKQARAEVARQCLILGLTHRTPQPATQRRQPTPGPLRPLAAILVDWITAPKDNLGRRHRFRQYSRNALHSYKVVHLLLTAARDARQDTLSGGQPLTEGFHLLIADEPWKELGQLFFEVVAELGDRGISLGLAA